MTLLASDLINPAFVGAKNPDDMLAVEFYWNVVKNMQGKSALDENGKETRIPYVRISVPGNETNMVDVPVREEHKRRWPRHWQYFQVQETELDPTMPGWKLEEWPELSKEQLHELKYLRFSVVEQIAGASDTQVQRMGMNGASLRLKAREALKAKQEDMFRKEITQRDLMITDLQDGQKRLQEQIAQLIELAQKSAKPDAPPKRT